MINDTPTDAPINVARPQWQCPHCGRNYSTDLAAATRCAQAGPPAPAPDGLPVLILPSSRSDGESPAIFDLSKAGPVKVETIDGALRHRRDVTVGTAVVDARTLTEVTPADLMILVNERQAESSGHITEIGPSGYGLLEKLFGRHDHSSSAPPVWLARRWQESLWWRAPDEQERALLNMLTGDLLDRVASMDVNKYAADIEANYRTDAYRGRATHLALASPEGALSVAEAHGAPSHVWALRWLSAHAGEVARWQAHTAIGWAAGTGGSLPLAAAPHVSGALPKNPGKKRDALMAPYGADTYAGAMRALADLLTADAPSMPVPKLGDVTAELHKNQKEGHRVR